MKITKNQKELLNSFICERFSSNTFNIKLIDSFKSNRGESLVDYLKQNGWLEDKDGKTAYYIIKTK